MSEAGTRARWRFVSGNQTARDGGAVAGDGLPADDANVALHARALRINPLVAALLINRNLHAIEDARAFMSPALSQLRDPAGLPGVPRAAERIVEAVRNREPIVIYGDYDVDGITAAAILWHTLVRLGARVTTYVPHRIDEGYGLNPEAIRSLAADHSLIVSVDCGMTAVEPARVARDAGVDLIITDHHEFDPNALPDALAIVHPRLDVASGGADASSSTSKLQNATSEIACYPQLCGAGVAFKLAWQVARMFVGSDRLPDHLKELMVDLLSLAALGTVADVVPLIDENRVIVKHGLGRIKYTNFIGLNALIDAARLRDEKIDAYHVGFVLGPRINACGRMGHAKDAVRLLTEATEEEARQTAEFLTKENDRRRQTEKGIFDEAKTLAEDAGYTNGNHRAIVLGKTGWHAGVLGIVASRMSDLYCRPSIMLSCDGNEATGSARSVDGVSIHEALCHCESLLESFGGHAMAAGLRLKVERIEEFREMFIAYVNERLREDELRPSIDVDLACALDDLTFDVFEQVQSLAPFGRSNPHPILCARGAVLDDAAMPIGRSGDHLRLWLRGAGGNRLQAVAFGFGAFARELPRGAKVDVLFEPKISTWNGRRRAELHIKDFRHAGATSQFTAAKAIAVEAD